MINFVHNRHSNRDVAASPYKGKYTEVMEFSGPEAMVKTCLDLEAKQTQFRHNIADAEFVKGPKSFSSYKDVQAAVTAPWLDGIKTVKDMLVKLAKAELPQPKCRRRRVRFDENDGDEVCLDRLEAGRPWWRTTRREEAVGPSIMTLGVQIGGSAGLRSGDLMWRGAAAIAMMQLLEDVGYSCELYAYSYAIDVFDSHDDILCFACVKRAGDYLMLPSLVNCIAGWYFRTVSFGCYHACPSQHTNDGMGIQKAIKTELVGYMTPDPEQVILVDQVFDFDSAVTLASKVLSKLSGKLID